ACRATRERSRRRLGGVRRANPGWETVKAEIERGHGAVSRRRLLEIGTHPNSIRSRLDSGRLVAVFAGVYRLEGARLGEKGRWHAAVLQAGPGAVLADRSSLALHGLLEEKGQMKVMRVSGRHGRGLDRRVSRDGWSVRVRRTRHLPERDRCLVDGIPTVIAERALIDAAAELTGHEIRSALTRALRLRKVDWERLRDMADRSRTRKGVRHLRAAMTIWSGEIEHAASELEERAFWLLAEAGLPVPAVNVPCGRWVIDLFWAEQRVAVELDGYAYHSDLAAFKRDRTKDRELRAAGLDVARFTWDDVVNDSDGFVAAVRRMLARDALLP
ncbi:MAG: DUF559 domain-containing protein, partial [Solirubrobacterales bacterium]|nr:DUF559 domain-containing protein [Solirubrobacterales bacterium]